MFKAGSKSLRTPFAIAISVGVLYLALVALAWPNHPAPPRLAPSINSKDLALEVPYIYANPDSVLVVEGRDQNAVAAALSHGAKKVDALSGSGVIRPPSLDPRVRLIPDGLRHWLATSGEKYDLVIFSSADTGYTADQRSGFVLDVRRLNRDVLSEVWTHLTAQGSLWITERVWRFDVWGVSLNSLTILKALGSLAEQDFALAPQQVVLLSLKPNVPPVEAGRLFWLDGLLISKRHLFREYSELTAKFAEVALIEVVPPSITRRRIPQFTDAFPFVAVKELPFTVFEWVAVALLSVIVLVMMSGLFQSSGSESSADSLTVFCLMIANTAAILATVNIFRFYFAEARGVPETLLVVLLALCFLLRFIARKLSPFAQRSSFVMAILATPVLVALALFGKMQLFASFAGARAIELLSLLLLLLAFSLLPLVSLFCRMKVDVLLEERRKFLRFAALGVLLAVPVAIWIQIRMGLAGSSSMAAAAFLGALLAEIILRPVHSDGSSQESRVVDNTPSSTAASRPSSSRSPF